MLVILCNRFLISRRATEELAEGWVKTRKLSRLNSCLVRDASVALLAFSAVFVTLLCGVATRLWGTGASPTLKEFVGYNNPIGGKFGQPLGAGWERSPLFLWYVVEPQEGQWVWTRPDQDVQQAQGAGIQVLPILGFPPDYAAATPHRAGVSAPTSVSAWEDYVDHVVSRYSSSPYNLRYFQIWNEPVRRAFWPGTDEEFVDMIFLPAAKVIRRHGCKVVFGGWPVSNRGAELDSVLNYHNAWQYTDIVDVHYHTLADLQLVYSNWIASGKCHGLWQTEVGYTSEPGASSSLYSRTLYWTLQAGWNDPNEFKLFWYPGEGAGDNAEKSLVRMGAGTLTDEGRHLAVLNQVLGGGPLSTFTQFNTTPPVSGSAGSAWAMGYHVGSSRVVIQFLMDRSFFRRHQTVQVSLNAPGRPSKVQLMSGLGQTWDVPAKTSGGRVRVDLDFRKGFDDCPKCKDVQGYLILD